MKFDKFFWFSQPSSVLNTFDNIAGYAAVGLLAAAILLCLFRWFAKDKFFKQVISKYYHLTLTTSILGLIWFAFRHENAQMFSNRYWIGLIFVSFVIWLAFAVKYHVVDYRRQVSGLQNQQLKEKYLPKKKR